MTAHNDGPEHYCLDCKPLRCTFDGKGINGNDVYASRLATLTEEGHRRNVGKLLACAPELLEALKECQRVLRDVPDETLDLDTYEALCTLDDTILGALNKVL
jgi:CTP:molybdopterin cytidylyltransferase MocA